MAVKGPSEVDPKHMMRGINNVGAGWHPLVRELEAKLLEMDQSYILDQIKEKFGGLRYYATNSTTKVDYAAFHALIHAAEGDSFQICEVCGKQGSLKSVFGWYKTLCEDDFDKVIRDRQKEMTEHDHGGQG